MIRISDIYKLNNSKDYILDTINNNWLTFTGEYVNKCEEKLKEIFKVKHVLLTNNGTSATHCIIKSIKFKYPKCNKLYIQNNCYIAAYNMALLEFSETQLEILPIDDNTWNLDLNYINQIEKNSALLVVHNIGNILPIQKIKELRPDIIIIEDNCEGFMGEYNNKMSGTECLASSISFFSNKHITCGEGGAFITNDTDIYNKIVKFARQGITDKKYIHNMFAFNYKLNNMQAALLYSQLELLEEIIFKKKKLFKLYNKLLNKYSDKISIQKIEENTIHSYWLYGIKFLKNINYNEIEEYFLKNNIEIRPFFYDFRLHEHLKNIKSNDIIKNNNIILLPLHPNLTEYDINYIISLIDKYLNILY
jgi:perosamine synthetase